jgi:hypothetical protein
LKTIRWAFNAAYSAATILFFFCGVALVMFAGMELCLNA